MPAIEHVLQEYWGGNPAQKNQLLKSVIEKAFYYKDKSAEPDDFIISLILKDILELHGLSHNKQ